MPERLRFSNDPETIQILTDFALRLDPALSVENLVLADIKTNLHYADGQTFVYSLEPKNFSVQEHAEYEVRRSPINGMTRRRKVTFSIRDESGNEHEPIGTTSILKDIFGLEARHVHATERFLLETTHHARQEEIWQQALQSGDSLAVYAQLNNLSPHYFSPSYVGSLSEQDPIRSVLHRILNGTGRLNRATAKELSKRQAKESQLPEKVKGQQTPLQLATTPVIEAPRVSITNRLLLWLAPAYEWIRKELSAQRQQQLEQLIAIAQRTQSAVQSQRIDLPLLEELRRLTGLQITDAECLHRANSNFRLSPEKLVLLDEFCDEAVDSLGCGYVQGAMLIINARRGHLSEREFLMLDGRLVEFQVCQRLGINQDVSLSPLIQKSDVELRDYHTRTYMSAEQQVRWQHRLPLLRFMGIDPERLQRVATGTLSHNDNSALSRLWEQARALPHSHIEVTRSLLEVLHHEEKEALRICMNCGIFPIGFRHRLAEIAAENDLDPTSYEPYMLQQNIRAWIQKHQKLIVSLSGFSRKELKNYLIARKLTREIYFRLANLPNFQVNGYFTPQQREYLMGARQMKRYAPQVADKLREALRTDSYVLSEIILLNDSLENAPEFLLPKEKRQEIRNGKLTDLKRRLTAQLNGTARKQAQVIESLSNSDFEKVMPRTIKLYFQERETIGSQLRQLALEEIEKYQHS